MSDAVTGRSVARPAGARPEVHRFARAFTLVELLVVVALIAMLLAVLLPSLAAARQHARTVLCQSNARQLHAANHNYSVENDDFYVPAAPDIFEGYGGRRRWHGVRQADGVDPDPAKNTFDPLKSPLRASLGEGGVKQCPEMRDFVRDGAQNAFEASCGGYGYNSVGVGSRTYEFGYTPQAMASSMRAGEIRHAAETVMFTDAAFVQGFPGRYLIEYSFSEPPRYLWPDGAGRLVEMGAPSPSVHFRHRQRANVVWCDGHASAERLAFTTLEEAVARQFRIGWFGPESNELFDPK